MTALPVDLHELATELADSVPSGLLVGRVVGRTVLRDAVAGRLGCSQLEAEQLVDTLIGRGYLRFEAGGEGGAWCIVRGKTE